MAGYSVNQFFQGDLEGQQLRDYYKLDNSKTLLEDRKKVLEELLGEKGNYFTEYIESHYKAALNASDPTSENINVFKTLETMANYLLNCEESKAIDQLEKPEYVFHTNNDYFGMKRNRELFNMNSDDGNTNMVDNSNIVHALIKKQGNSRVPKTQKITQSDLERKDFCGVVLRGYQSFLDHIDNKIKETKDNPDHLWRKYLNAKGSVKKDMLDVKDMLLGVWGYNTQIKEGHIPDYDIFDFTDVETVRYLLQLSEPQFGSDFDMWLTWKEFEMTVKKANLTTQEQLVVYCLKNSWQLREISEEFDIDYDRLRRTIMNTIIKKIIKLGNKYDAFDIHIANKIQLRKEKNKNEED